MSEEFVPSAPVGAGESGVVAPPGQGGAAGGTSVAPEVVQPQIAESSGEPVDETRVIPYDDVTRDPRVQEWQSKSDKRINALEKELERERAERLRIQQEAEAERQRREEAAFNAEYQRRLNSARTPQDQALIKAEYKEKIAERKMASVTQMQQQHELRTARDTWANRFYEAGYPEHVIQEAIQTAGPDLNAQIEAIASLGYRYRGPMRGSTPAPAQGGYPPAPAQPAQPAPAQPAQPAPAAHAPVRRPATPVARPGTVTPAPQDSLAVALNKARETGDYTEYEALRQRKIREAKAAERRRYGG